MASARLRKAFRYPDDSGDDTVREELDEEEQERVIRHLQIQNEKRNSEYTIIFATIPLLSSIIFIPSLLSSASVGVFVRFLLLLSIGSLLATAYTMKYIPPQRPDPKGKRPMRNPDLMTHVRKYAVPVNTAVCVLLALVYLFSSNTGLSSIQPVAYLVPPSLRAGYLALLATILVVRQVMVSVDLKTLEDLRYDYKGA
ncbi:hypothetical protein ARAM_003093 [Aspergillus rambellii]|uniref:Uncharacterized protein n=1 Tax=Aspergillus rambellii TaxID=308745 RepID=A0A0F8V0K6_9EURO|nr:hypothetical protein ARAM_003093 [Aspergillus rambellii]